MLFSNECGCLRIFVAVALRWLRNENCMRRCLYIWLLPLVVLVACADRNEERFPNTPLGNFDALWQCIDRQYCYLDYKRVNWDSVYTVYRLAVEALGVNADDRELFDLFADMLDVLEDGHVNLYSDFDVSRNRSWYEDYPVNYNSSVIYNDRYLGKDYKVAGGLTYERIAEGRIGYIRYDSFSSGFSSANLWHVFNYFSDCTGLIIDVRHNGGGSLTYADLLASPFFTQETVVGYIRHKTGYGHSEFSEPRPMKVSPHSLCRWERPVAVLVNRNSYSATNRFACSMQYVPHAVLVGGRTGGGGGMPLSTELPNGWVVRFSAVPMYDAAMQPIENGIEPDLTVNLDKDSVNAGLDNIIEQAVNYLLQQ